MGCLTTPGKIAPSETFQVRTKDKSGLYRCYVIRDTGKEDGSYSIDSIGGYIRVIADEKTETSVSVLGCLVSSTQAVLKPLKLNARSQAH